MTHYTDPDLIAALLKRDLATSEQLTLAIVIPAIDKYIDKKCDMTFLEVAETTRYYDGGEETLEIDPCTAITAVASLNDDGTTSYTYVTGDYEAGPYNQTVKNELRKRYSCWPKGNRRIAVTAKFSGWDSGVPQDIQMAATMIAASVLTAGSQVGGVKSESLEGHSITYDDTSNIIQSVAEKNPIINSIFMQYKQLVVE